VLGAAVVVTFLNLTLARHRGRAAVAQQAA
jgi:hypothetical protein